MKHKLLTTATLLLFVLLTWSCTNDDEPVMTTPPAITNPDASALSITIGPRPQFAVGNNQPATRAIQTPGGTQWEAGDVLWLYVHFSWIPSGKGERDREYKNYVSALRYNGTEWRQLSEEDCSELNTSSIEPYTDPDPDPQDSKRNSYLGFVSNPCWPAEAFAEGVTDAEVLVDARYLGKDTPNEEGIISLNYNTDYMNAGTTAPIGTPINLNLGHGYARLHITDEATLKCTKVWCYNTWDLASGKTTSPVIPELSVPKGGSYYFVGIQADSKFTLDGIPYTLAPGRTDEYGNKRYNGYTYTLTPLKHGTVTPGE